MIKEADVSQKPLNQNLLDEKKTVTLDTGQASEMTFEGRAAFSTWERDAELYMDMLTA